MLLKDICMFYKGIPLKRDLTNVNYDVPYLHYGDLYKYYSHKINIEKLINRIIKVNSTHYNIKYQIEHNNIVMNLTSENYSDLGKSVIIKNPNNIKFMAGMETHLIKIISKKIIPDYLNYYFESKLFINNIIQFVTGMKVFRVKPKDILRIEIDIPNIKIQQHIIDSIRNYPIYLPIS